MCAFNASRIEHHGNARSSRDAWWLVARWSQQFSVSGTNENFLGIRLCILFGISEEGKGDMVLFVG